MKKALHPYLVFHLFWLFSLVFSVKAQVGIDISLARSDYLLYEAIEVQVKLTNLSAKALDLTQLSGDKPWLDFYVTTTDEEQIPQSEQSLKIPKLTLAAGEIKKFSLNLLPYFLIRERGEYVLTAQLQIGEKTVSSRRLKFLVVNTQPIWEQHFNAPPDPNDPIQQLRARHYSLLIHRAEGVNMLYVRIKNPEQNRVYCTTSIGPIVNFGDPKARIDPAGNLHLLHQSGTRIFNYTSFSPAGARLKVRCFSNISSPPTMFVDSQGETEIVGGEEIFYDKEGKQTVIPTPPSLPPSSNKN